MSSAKTMKLKEYGTDILSHNAQQIEEPRRTRENNTFKSTFMDSNKDMNIHKAKSRDRIFVDRPLTAQVKRASYQDSNIFGYKDQNSETVQLTAQQNRRDQQIRQSATFSSRVFSLDPVSEEVLTQKGKCQGKCEEKWKSTVFAGPIQNETKRKKLGQSDAGTENLFGQAKVDYDNKSNKINILTQPRKEKKWQPVRKEKTAEQRKNEELYGRSVAIYGVGKKGDGTLMANGADWRNLQQKHTNAHQQQSECQGGAAKDKKFGNLSSNIPGLVNPDNQIPLYNPDAEKAIEKTPKIINKGGKVDTFQKKKAQLSSSVFDLPDYQEYVPMKKQGLDINNLTDNKRKQDHMYSDILGQSGVDYKVKSPIKQSNDNSSQVSKRDKMRTSQGFNTKDAKTNQMRSALDTHNYEVDQFVQQSNVQEVAERSDFTLIAKKSTAIKVKDLSSDILGTGNTAAKYAAGTQETMLVDLDLQGLSENTQPDDLKKISGVKHVISAIIDQDSIRNICTGTGRVKLRINANDDLDNIKLQYVKAGFSVTDHTDDNKKKAAFTTEATLQMRSPQKQDTNAKLNKQSNLQSQNPEIFGNSSQHQIKYNVGEQKFDYSPSKNEALAMSNWQQVKK